jgi:hypothetical protein
VVVVVVVVMMPVPPAMVMVVMMVMVVLRKLDIFIRRGDRCGFIDRQQQCRCIRNRSKQIRK